ncbi:MAG TPA: hypothetical protein VLZ05_05525 [Mycobacterium sp.]|nr:hypothetical protein [Mycobacterium sp.]HUH68374.1 hypothetical protein [Mycobacterium sp.]
MASPHQPDDAYPGPYPAKDTDSPIVPEDVQDFPEESPESPDGFADSPDAHDGDPEAPRVLRLRIAAWDVISTLAMWGALVLIATMTNWPSRLFGFTSEICEGERCGPVPYGIDYYIHPLVWGGIGAAIAAAVLGPFVSMLKGWYMSFWPVLALAIIIFVAVAGSTMTAFSQRYWQ